VAPVTDQPMMGTGTMKTIALPIRNLSLVGIAILCLAAGCREEQVENPPPVIRYTPLPERTPVPLEIGTIEKFVDWVSTMPSSQVPAVKEQIAKVASDPVLVDAVASKLSFKAPGSYGRQLIYLSILGEMKNERALGALQIYLASADCPVFEEFRAVNPPAGINHTSYLDTCAGLKSAAVNMIAYLNSPAARDIVLEAVQSHASRAVRLSAMNSYLYNNNDSPDALALVRRYARKDEVKFVGLPRLAPQFSLKDFDERVARFYEEHPGELQQPVPARISRAR
jgi:hypothetical protein